MILKTTVNKQDFFNRLINKKCKFKKVCGLYPAKCKNIKYIGQLKDFKEIEVFQINDKEAELFKALFKTFKNSEIKIIKNGD